MVEIFGAKDFSVYIYQKNIHAHNAAGNFPEVTDILHADRLYAITRHTYRNRGFEDLPIQYLGRELYRFINPQLLSDIQSPLNYSHLSYNPY